MRVPPNERDRQGMDAGGERVDEGLGGEDMEEALGGTLEFGVCGWVVGQMGVGEMRGWGVG